MTRSASKLEQQSEATAVRGGASEPVEIGTEVFSRREVMVRTGRNRVLEFLRATGGQIVEDFVPLTFPFCWLSLPEVRSVVEALICRERALPVHEAQSFSYQQRLEIETDYVLDIEFSRTAKPPRLTLSATIATRQGTLCGRLETVLRIVPIA